MVELVDTPDLGSGAARYVGSSPILGISPETFSEMTVSPHFSFSKVFGFLKDNRKRWVQAIGSIFFILKSQFCREDRTKQFSLSFQPSLLKVPGQIFQKTHSIPCILLKTRI